MTADDPMRPHPRLRLERDGATLRVILSAPERRNAQVPTLWAALETVATTLPEDVRVVVLAGDGPTFSAGLDRGMLEPGGLPGEPSLMGRTDDPAAVQDAIAGYQRAFTAWRECPAVVVAAVQGQAIGAGFQLALAADLRVMTTDAVFVMAEVRLGLVPDLGGTGILAALVGESRAFEICATGRPVTAQEAVDIGLANLAVDPAELGATVDDLVSALLAAPDATMREMVGLFRGIRSRSVEDQLALERAAQARMLARKASGGDAERRA